MNSAKLKEARINAGMALSDAARELGFKTPTGYWHLEKGDRCMTATQLYKFSKVVGLPMEHFFD